MKKVFTPTKKKTILILDDDQPASQGYREELEAHGFKVELTSAFDTTLQSLRNGTINLTRTQREDLRRAALLQMHRQIHSLAGSTRLCALRKLVALSTALEALVVELYTEPAKTTRSVVRTIAHAIETLASLFDRPVNS